MRSPLRALLVLGRVSNCPTVWSNCLAAWCLSGGGSWERLAVLCGGTTLLYTGGMFLNDACDVTFDRQYRGERPIPAGQVSRRAVAVIGAALGKASAGFGGLLVVAIVVYDLVHKHTSASPLLMATCRILVYLVTAANAPAGLGWPVVSRALALGAYVAGLSYWARSEAK